MTSNITVAITKSVNTSFFHKAYCVFHTSAQSADITMSSRIVIPIQRGFNSVWFYDDFSCWLIRLMITGIIVIKLLFTYFFSIQVKVFEEYAAIGFVHMGRAVSFPAFISGVHGFYTVAVGGL